MRHILAIETTETIGSVAAGTDNELLLELRLDSSQRSTQSLAPGIKRLLGEVGWRPADVDLVAVTIGPGSFTGLRVGIATAKVFAYAVEAEVLGLDTLEVIAAGAPADVSSLSVAIDAQRGEVVARSFRRGSEGSFEPQNEAELLAIEEWLAGLEQGSIVSGPALCKWRKELPLGITALPDAFWRPTAGSVLRLASKHYAAGRRNDLWKLLPVYSRRAAAEEKWEKKAEK